MKTIPPPCPIPETGPKYWRSLDQLSESPQFRQWVEREFPAGASEMTDPVTRRGFVKLMSASFLLAGFGLTGCRRPVENIYPFSKMPEGYVHGVPKLFATSMPTRNSAIPLLAKSSDGRPTKLEGNPKFPGGNGGTDRFAQASILNLYDADRATRFTKDGVATAPETVMDDLKALSDKARASGGKGLSFLAEQSSSPSRARLQKLVADQLPQAKWHVYEPVDFDIHRQAASVAFDQPVTLAFKLDEAKVIVSLDSDFIGSEEDAHANIRQFAKGRKLADATPDNPTPAMSRLYSVEGLMTLTGINADHRLRVPPSAVVQVAALIAREVLRQSDPLAGGLAEAAGKLVNDVAVKGLTDLLKPDAKSKREWSADWITKWAAECAKDLVANRGACVVLAGHRQPQAVHLLAHALNVALGNVGHTVEFHDAPAPADSGIAGLVKSLNAGEVETLVILGGNPAYNAPADLKWSDALAKSKAAVVRLGYYEDESFPAKGWSLPLAHYLESWGDARTGDGTLVSIQPLIEPLFGGMTELELIARILGQAKTGAYEIVRETFQTTVGGDEEAWKKFLHDGYQAGTAAKPVDVTFRAASVAGALASAPAVTVPDKGKLEVVFHRDYSVDDGRFVNNGWLQELPDPVTKITWENTILLSKRTADDLGLEIINHENNQLVVPWVKIDLDGRSVEGPAWVQPGQADYVIGLALGYGRSKTGRVGVNSGYDAYSVRTGASPHCGTGAKLTDTGRKQQISTTQDHGSMEGRPIIREATLDEYHKDAKFATEMRMETPPGMEAGKAMKSLYPNPFDEERKAAHHQWGMSIDLNSCVGCSACMMACQSENNVPIVGKTQVANNREMHWLRLDRYYTGEVDDPQVVTQPMLCQHCEAAPCENVCPVNATSHDAEGLNVMTYNRCVGTRYCSNNCPYKVRRFNFFDYNRRSLEQLAGTPTPVGPVYSTPLTHSTEGEWDLLRWWRDPDRGTMPSDQWELLKLVKNPDVTVRMRGVMEKCSFCVQRIESAKIAQKVQARDSGDVIVPDGVIKTACQQACPAEAIVFGNIADPESRVSKLKAQHRDYSVLEFLNTKPRTTYLARVRNPNPAMPDAYVTPWSTKEFKEHNGEEGGAEPVEAGKKGGA